MRFTKLGVATVYAGILLATTAITTPAFADPPEGSGNGNGNCGVGNGNGGPVECHGGGGGGGGEGGGGGGGGGNGGTGGNAEQQQQQQQQQGQVQIQGQANSQDVNVTTNNNTERAPVNTAYAAPLVTGEDTCMGSSSVGGQGIGFGLSIGTTWTDTNCQRLKNSRQLASLGFTRAAVALVCVDEDVQGAMDAAGTPCPVTREQKAELERQRAEAREEAAERHAEETQRVATYETPAAPAAVEAPKSVAAPKYNFAPMQPIKD